MSHEDSICSGTADGLGDSGTGGESRRAVGSVQGEGDGDKLGSSGAMYSRITRNAKRGREAYDGRKS